MNRGRHKKQSKYPNTWLTKVMTDAQLDLLFKRAEQQGKYPSLQDIEQTPTGGNILVWGLTPEGRDFWNKILSKVNNYKNDRC